MPPDIARNPEFTPHLLRRALASVYLAFALLLLSQIRVSGGQPAASHVEQLFRVTERLTGPLRIAIDDGDNIYVTDALRGKVCRYDSAGDFLGDFADGARPLGIAVTRQRLIYLSDGLAGSVQLVDGNGRVLRTIRNGPRGFGLPACLALDGLGWLYIVDGKRGCVYIFDERGDYVASFGREVLVFPTSLAYDSKNQRLLVAEHGGLYLSDPERGRQMIHAFDRQGQRLTSFGDYGPEKHQFTRIQGMAADRQGRVYVADPFQGVVSVLNEEGEYLCSISGFGKEPGRLRAPMDVAIDSRDRLWVASMNNGCLEVYDVGGIPTAVEGTPGAEGVPVSIELLQNYPNPFNPGTWLPFVLTKDRYAVVHIYNEMGQLIRTLDVSVRKQGESISNANRVFWDGTNSQGDRVASGVYYYELRTDGFLSVRRMLLLSCTRPQSFFQEETLSVSWKPSGRARLPPSNA